ncbi:MAG: helix-turn-helix transcriptional regulator [Anaerotignum sp.]|nr:helix-turn-helix transcriptional regulator [Anaerotignum sp.]
MRKRLREIRKKLGYTQNEFGERIGITGSTVSDIERGKLSLTERNISLICEKLGVNKNWLKNGEGEMFDTYNLPEDEITRALASIETSNYENVKSLLLKYVQLDDNGKKVIDDFLNYFLNMKGKK